MNGKASHPLSNDFKNANFSFKYKIKNKPPNLNRQSSLLFVPEKINIVYLIKVSSFP